MKRLSVALVVLALAVVAAAGAASASTAGHWTPVRMTVDYPWFSGTPETVVGGTMVGCEIGDTVETVPAEDQLLGNLWIFTGTKTFSCTGGQFELAYRAYRIGDASSSLGTWMIVDGTGLFEGMRGIGVVQGRYTYDDAGQKTGLIDYYVGLVMPAH